MSTQTVSHFYGHDHDDLDEALKQFQLLKREDFAKAKPFFRKFKFGLQRHILWEEEILFPLFELKTGVKNAGPTQVMRQEHEMIKEALEILHTKVRQNNPDSDQEEKVLIELLSMHNYKEENILYPMIDHSTTDQEKQKMFELMQEVPQERYASCGCHHH